jgi:hypothetical protein
LALVASDMDHDGILDLIVALGGSDHVVVLKGDGEGGFHHLSKQISGKGTNFLAVRDVNGDGWEDVIAVNSGRFGYYPPFNLSVLLNDGQGKLQGPVTYENDGRDGMFPTGVVVKDLTGDGLPDLAVSWSQPSWRSPNGLVAILANSGEGVFVPFMELQAGWTLSSIHSADFNHDGLEDLVVTSLFTDTIRILLQQDTGEFQPLEPFKVGFAPVGLAIHDFDGDGEIDLVVVNRDSNSLSLLLGEGNGMFRSGGHFGVGATPAAVVVQDFDQDEFPDLATANTNDNSVSVLLSGGGAIPQPSMSADALVFEIESDRQTSAPSAPQQMLRVSNIGLGKLRVFDMAILGTEATAFSMTENTCAGITLRTGDSCTVQVGFSVKTQGTHHATLTIQDNGSGSSRLVALKGKVK